MAATQQNAPACARDNLGISIADVGGIPFGITKLDQAVDWLIDRTTRHTNPLAIRLANAYCVALAKSDSNYLKLMTEHGVNFPDGMPVAVLLRVFARKSGYSASQVGRVRGPSFFEATLDKGRAVGLRHFFLGTTPQTLDKLTYQLQAQYPGIRISGTYSPPFGPLSDSYIQECTEQVEATKTDIVWVGIGTPKQDFLTHELVASTGKHCIGVGAAFDFSAKTMKEAPKWIQNSGFEWLYRFASEPRRLWKRYLIGNIQFTGAVFIHNVIRRG